MATVPGTPDPPDLIPKELRPTQADIMIAAAMHAQQQEQQTNNVVPFKIAMADKPRPPLSPDVLGTQMEGGGFPSRVPGYPRMSKEPAEQPAAIKPEAAAKPPPQSEVMAGRNALIKGADETVQFAKQYGWSDAQVKVLINDNFSAPWMKTKVFNQYLKAKE